MIYIDFDTYTALQEAKTPEEKIKVVATFVEPLELKLINKWDFMEEWIKNWVRLNDEASLMATIRNLSVNERDNTKGSCI